MNEVEDYLEAPVVANDDLRLVIMMGWIAVAFAILIALCITGGLHFFADMEPSRALFWGGIGAATIGGLFAVAMFWQFLPYFLIGLGVLWFLTSFVRWAWFHPLF